MLIDIPQICPLCGRKKINLNDNESIYNPVIALCTYNKCRKIIYLRQGTILDHYSKVPASVFFYVINLWIICEKNDVQIHKFLSENLENYSISLKCIHEILETSRYYIANFYKHQYVLEDISNTNFNERLSVDESKFTSEGNENIWVIGVINNRTKQFRLEISKLRNSNVLKKFIFAYVKPGNIIMSDRWAGYDFLSIIHLMFIRSIITDTVFWNWIRLDKSY